MKSVNNRYKPPRVRNRLENLKRQKVALTAGKAETSRKKSGFPLS